MRMWRIFSVFLFAFISGNTFALNNTSESQPQAMNNMTIIRAESAIESTIEQQTLDIVAEELKLSGYSGVLGTAPDNQTISAVGGVFEETPTGPQLAVLWTQTLKNGVFYEIRGTGQYNIKTQNPIYPGTPVSSEDNPPGMEASGKIGYNFHVIDDYYITPYVKAQIAKDMSLVYQDTQGNYIHSNSYAFFLGVKQAFVVSNKVSPYIDLSGGYTNVSLNGVLQQTSGANTYETANATQLTFYTEFGASYRINNHQAIAPYLQYIYTVTRPDALAALPYADGGFNVTSLTTTTQTFGIKYSYAW